MNEASGVVAIVPKSISEAKDLAKDLALSRLLPEALQKSPVDVFAVIATGAELGLAPMQSLRGITIIKGKPTLSADLMGALVRSSPQCEYLKLDESTAKVARYSTKRRGDPSPTLMSWTIEEAQQAGLAGGDNWRKYPAAMLRARCLSALCRAVYSDLLLGVYDPDELATPEERDVTPPKAVVSTVVEKTEALKRRLNIVDGDAPAPQSSPPAAPGVETVGWGKHTATPLAELTDEQLRWYLDDAEKKAKANSGDGSLAWAAHHARYVAEAARRAAAPAPFVAEVTP